MAATGGRRVGVGIRDGVAHITLDDGKVNAMSTAMLEDIGEALEAAEAAGAIAVLYGREGIFSAGFDFATFARGPEAAVEMVEAGARLVERVLRLPLPVVTVCTGHAYPMGAFLLLAADVRIGVDGPWRIGLNEVAIGLTVPRFAIELARHRLSAPGLARVSTAPLFGPAEALRHGFLDRVVAAAELDEAVRGEVERLRGLHLDHFAPTKARVNEPVAEAVAAALEAELAAARGMPPAPSS